MIKITMTVNSKYNKQHVAQSMTGIWEPMTEEQRRFLVDNIVIREYGKNQAI